MYFGFWRKLGRIRSKIDLVWAFLSLVNESRLHLSETTTIQADASEIFCSGIRLGGPSDTSQKTESAWRLSKREFGFTKPNDTVVAS